MTVPDTAIESLPSDCPAPKRRFRRPVLFGLLYVLYVALLLCGGLKFFWWWRYDVGVTESPANVEAVWKFYYPSLYRSGVLQADLSPADGHYDVLLLGGSVLEQTEPELRRLLREQLGDQFRLFDLATSAHTSRDSFLKHTRLGDRHFDLVVFYHGINDARLNRCPDEEFRADYTHLAWYRSLQKRLQLGRMSIADIVQQSIQDGMKPGPDDEEWAIYSNRVKTAESFRNNLVPIVKAAEDRHAAIVLMTYAYDLPPNYSEEAFHAQKLDYGAGQYSCAVSIWGSPEGVKKAIDAHNRVIREVAAQHKDVIFVDQQALMPTNGTHFSDVCHLTDQGIQLFVRHLMQAIQGDIERWKLKEKQRADKKAPKHGGDFPPSRH